MLSSGTLALVSGALLVTFVDAGGWAGLPLRLLGLALAVGGAVVLDRRAAANAGRAAGAAAGTATMAAEPVERVPLPNEPPGSALADTLAEVRRWCGAERAVLWQLGGVPAGPGIRADIGAAATPVAHSGGAVPSAQRLAGSPLRLAAAAAGAMRVDPPPEWSRPGTAVTALAIAADGGSSPLVLTLETARDHDPAVALLDAVRAAVAASHALDATRSGAAAAGKRQRRLLAALEELASADRAEGFTERLLTAAVAITDATGGALAQWRDAAGVILDVAGSDGGPATGATFRSPESDLAHAVRAGSPIVRSSADRLPAGGGSSAVAAHGERWLRPPSAWAAIPLGPPGAPTAVVAVWTSRETELPADGIEMLRVVGPFVGLQLEAVLAADALRDSAERDPLTGLLNRRGFEARFETERARVERYGRPLALLIVDIDHFKSVNDRFGHAAGDAALQAVARCIRSGLRDLDVAARLGGEEFAVLLPETGLGAAHDVGERLREAVGALPTGEGALPVAIRASIGVSAVPECVRTAGELLDSADQALYAAKNGGRDRVCDAPRYWQNEGVTG